MNQGQSSTTADRSLAAAEQRAVWAALLPSFPVTSAAALDRGLDYRRLRDLVAHGLVRHPLRGVYVLTWLPDDLPQRLAALRLVVPPDCVVTDRTAAWLWGATMALPPGAHTQAPPVSVFAPPGRRLRNGLVASGERGLSGSDVVDLEGLLVTSPVRTACDVARLLPRYQAIGVLDSLARAHPDVVEERLSPQMGRFKGYRGVIQGRELVTLIDIGAESSPESEVRLRMVDLGLHQVCTQVSVPSPEDEPYRIDVGLEDRRLGVEYFGEEFHGQDEEADDEERLVWLRQEHHWTMLVVRRANLYGRHQDFETLLRVAYAEASAKPRVWL